MTPATIAKRCSCGLTYDRAGWEALQHVGIHTDGVTPERLDLRNCSCRSTVAVELPDTVSICEGCSVWVDNEKTVTHLGAFCAKCGPSRTKDCQRDSARA